MPSRRALASGENIQSSYHASCHASYHASCHASYHAAEHSSFVSAYRLSNTVSSWKSGAIWGAEGQARRASARDGSKPGERSEKPGTPVDFSRKASPELRASCKRQGPAHGQLPEPAQDDVARRTNECTLQARKQRIPANHSSLVHPFRPLQRIIAQITVQIAAPCVLAHRSPHSLDLLSFVASALPICTYLHQERPEDVLGSSERFQQVDCGDTGNQSPRVTFLMRGTIMREE
jgi:hypothetical protein